MSTNTKNQLSVERLVYELHSRCSAPKAAPSKNALLLEEGVRQILSDASKPSRGYGGITSIIFSCKSTLAFSFAISSNKI